MHIFINSRSIDKQAADLPHITHLFDELVEIRRILQESIADVNFYRDAPSESRFIGQQMSFKDALISYSKQLKGAERTKFVALSQMFTKHPFAYNRFPELVGHECCWNHREVKEDETGYAVAYAAYFSKAQSKGIESSAAVLSVKDHPHYNEIEFQMLYSDPNNGIMERSVWNIAEQKHFLQHCRKYERNIKHNIPSDLTGYVAAMTIDDVEAQRLLNEGVKLAGETRVIARKGGKIYIFPCHLKGNPDNKEPYEGYYHGFECKVQDLRRRDGALFSRLRKECNWPELEI